MHALVPTQIGELSIRLQADLTLKWLHGAVDMLMLFQATRGRKGLSAISASVASCTDVLAADVPLKVAGVGEYLVAILAGKCSHTILILKVHKENIFFIMNNFIS